MDLWKNIRNSNALPGVVSWGLAGYLRLCFATTRWQRLGLNDLAKDLQNGPVILILWHEHLLIGPSAWPTRLAKLYTLRDPSHAGRLSSATQTRLGMAPIMMHDGVSNFKASRKILRVIRGGDSLGMTADGPLGPAHEAKQAALEWARATGRPIYLFAWSAARQKRLDTWDRLRLPLPFTRGVYCYRRWHIDVPRKLDDAGYRALRASLSDALNQVTTDIDRSAGIEPDD